MTARFLKRKFLMTLTLKLILCLFTIFSTTTLRRTFTFESESTGKGIRSVRRHVSTSCGQNPTQCSGRPQLKRKSKIFK